MRRTRAPRKGCRPGPILVVLLGCGLRSSEVAALTFKHIRQPDGRWSRTVPMLTWVKVAIDAWAAAAGITEGPVFRSGKRSGQTREAALSEKVVCQLI